MTTDKISLIQRVIETVLNTDRTDASDSTELQRLAQEVSRFDCRDMRVAIFGGGTGLSTVVGGNSQLPDWPDNACVGLKQVFSQLDVIVCTTDDGRSTGSLLKQLPMIGIGDLRKLCISMMLLENLQETYGIDDQQSRELIRLIHCVFNHRFPDGTTDFSCVTNPLLVAPQALRRICPEPLKELLVSLGTFLSPHGKGPTVEPGGHSLGNMLLTASIFMAAGRTDGSPPDMTHIRAGLDRIACEIGVTPGRLHPATAVPGQLVFRYGNGVEVCGQSKSSESRRGFPVERVEVEYYETPVVCPEVCKSIRNADLIILAPGSLYTSIIPVLQLPPLANAIRANQKALKILGANFWVQEGETDISRQSKNRGFRVSELIEAYHHNVPGGADGLFDIVLSTNLEHIPGDILRNYELEGKRPIYLDRRHVETLGIQPIEATLFSPRHLHHSSVIHHDPKKFALAIEVLLHARHHLDLWQKQPALHSTAKPASRSYRLASSLLCDYRAAIITTLEAKELQPKYLRDTMADLTWDNRDIKVEHLEFFRGARIIPPAKWKRSTEWDNILGYYDPKDRLIKVHAQLTKDIHELRGNLLIALGESLLGRYIESRRFIEPGSVENWASRCYEIRLRPVRERECFLSDSQLRNYLILARMTPHPTDHRTYRTTLNSNEGFLPPGLLFGLLYAWYLNNSYGQIMENEMSMLHWKPSTLIPHQVQEQKRKEALIAFFRDTIFGSASGQLVGENHGA
jgi:uncharacterized cofD-like protein